MSKEAELLDLFAEDENERYVLEIIQRRVEIRHHVIVKFLKEVQGYLQERMPAKDRWTLGLNEEYRSIPCWNSAVPEERQYLRYEVQQWFGEGHSHLALCLAWRDNEIWKRSKAHDVAVQQLAAPLKTAGFKISGDRWFRYLYVRVHDSDEDFLLRVVNKEAREELFRVIADRFWPLVEEMAKQVADANEQIAQLVQK